MRGERFPRVESRARHRRITSRENAEHCESIPCFSTHNHLPVRRHPDMSLESPVGHLGYTVGSLGYAVVKFRGNSGAAKHLLGSNSLMKANRSPGHSTSGRSYRPRYPFCELRSGGQAHLWLSRHVPHHVAIKFEGKQVNREPGEQQPAHGIDGKQEVLPARK